jgi:hypothetical protein
MNQARTSEDAWNRYLARPDINAAAITWARETSHILFYLMGRQQAMSNHKRRLNRLAEQMTANAGPAALSARWRRLAQQCTAASRPAVIGDR